MPIKAIIFDLDQTLLDRTTSLKKFLNWQTNFMQLVRPALKVSFIQRFLELDANGSVWKDRVYSQLIEEFQITKYSVSELLEVYIQDFNKFCTPFDDVEHTIWSLYKSGYGLGLISNGKTPFQEHNFYALGLQSFFSSVIVSEAVGLRKPDPQIFQLACGQLNVYPHEAIFIGDNWEVDIQGAKNAGLDVLYFQAYHSKMSSDTSANAMIHDFKSLLDRILEMSGKLNQ